MGSIGNYKSGLSSIALKANELRIGNLLFDNKEQLCSVDKLESDIDECGIYAIENATTYLPYHGVLLTEEILLKCGFLNRSFYVIGAGNSFKWQLDNFILLKNLDCKFYLPSMQHNIVLSSLHQLQNLYFSLTGEELKIDL